MYVFIYMVRPTGLEPAQISPQAPQACAATNYATDAFEQLYACSGHRIRRSIDWLQCCGIEPHSYLAYET